MCSRNHEDMPGWAALAKVGGTLKVGGTANGGWHRKGG
jgi:hypothetical protein